MYDLDWQLREKRNGAKHPRGFFVVVIGLLCVRRCRRARNAPPPRRVTSARSWSAWVATGWVGARKRRGHYPGLTTSISIITSIILLLLLFSFNACFPLFGTFFSLLMMNGGLPLPVLTCLPTYLLYSSRRVGPDRADLLFPHTRTHLPAYV